MEFSKTPVNISGKRVITWNFFIPTSVRYIDLFVNILYCINIPSNSSKGNQVIKYLVYTAIGVVLMVVQLFIVKFILNLLGMYPSVAIIACACIPGLLVVLNSLLSNDPLKLGKNREND